MIDEKLFPFIFWLNLKRGQRLTDKDLDFYFGYPLESHIDGPYPFTILVDLRRRNASHK